MDRDKYTERLHQRKSFNVGRLFLGLTLIIIGFLYLAKNTGWLPVGFNFNFIELWPILIVFLGLSMLSRHSQVSTTIGLIVTLLVLLLIAVMVLGGRYSSPTDNQAYLPPPFSI